MQGRKPPGEKRTDGEWEALNRPMRTYVQILQGEGVWAGKTCERDTAKFI